MKIQNVGIRSFMVPGMLSPGHTIDLSEHQALRLCSKYPLELVLVKEPVETDPIPPAPEAPKRRRKQ